MTIIQSHRVYIGASGWLHSQWDEHFYPEDLPQDWKLAYYGNEFPVVSVTEKEWQQGGEVSDWLEDTEDSPLFICELPLENISSELLMKAQPYLEKINQLGKRCLGIVCHLNNNVSPDEVNLLLQKCNQLAPTCVDSNGLCSDMLQDTLREQSANLVWGKVDKAEEVHGSLVVATISSQGLNLKQVRKLLDSLLHYDDSQHTIVLLVSGDDPDIEIIRQARMMLELM